MANVLIKFNQQRKIINKGVYRNKPYKIPSIRYGLFEEQEAGEFQPAWAARSNIIIQHGVS